ncbi:hypothetical protein [Sphingomonas corticis]|jgi:hypothetical protein|uniref:DUF4126 domain-containing protein n=1 Tax=Sphingomonas corticis TaxID=2722791 RepID=A0ABX1CMU1_9SPHN|nr:hypothetical protein [Sphingomonas corticis]NJR78248.1 hypothetical protein [Sphingomonas corticis]
MDYKKLSLGLGIFSIALGAVELLAPRRLTRVLDADGHEGLVRAFGARELLAGANLLMAPAHATNVWNRAAGDVMDIAAAGAAVANSPRNRATWGALAFVVGALALDSWVARGLDRQTGKTLPLRTDAAVDGAVNGAVPA